MPSDQFRVLIGDTSCLVNLAVAKGGIELGYAVGPSLLMCERARYFLNSPLYFADPALVLLDF